MAAHHSTYGGAAVRRYGAPASLPLPASSQQLTESLTTMRWHAEGPAPLGAPFLTFVPGPLWPSWPSIAALSRLTVCPRHGSALVPLAPLHRTGPSTAPRPPHLTSLTITAHSTLSAQCPTPNAPRPAPHGSTTASRRCPLVSLLAGVLRPAS